MKEDTFELIDREEAVSMMEPLLISSTSKHRGPLSDLALELAAQSARFSGSLPRYAQHSLAGLAAYRKNKRPFHPGPAAADCC